VSSRPGSSDTSERAAAWLMALVVVVAVVVSFALAVQQQHRESETEGDGFPAAESSRAPR
jgi:hypothetical protein